jgi:hypothetical protein
MEGIAAPPRGCYGNRVAVGSKAGAWGLRLPPRPSKRLWLPVEPSFETLAQILLNLFINYYCYDPLD